jgi:hypothetical protein
MEKLYQLLLPISRPIWIREHGQDPSVLLKFLTPPLKEVGSAKIKNEDCFRNRSVKDALCIRMCGLRHRIMERQWRIKMLQ